MSEVTEWYCSVTRVMSPSPSLSSDHAIDIESAEELVTCRPNGASGKAKRRKNGHVELYFSKTRWCRDVDLCSHKEYRLLNRKLQSKFAHKYTCVLYTLSYYSYRGAVTAEEVGGSAGVVASLTLSKVCQREHRARVIGGDVGSCRHLSVFPSRPDNGGRRDGIIATAEREGATDQDFVGRGEGSGYRGRI